MEMSGYGSGNTISRGDKYLENRFGISSSHPAYASGPLSSGGGVRRNAYLLFALVSYFRIFRKCAICEGCGAV